MCSTPAFLLVHPQRRGGARKSMYVQGYPKVINITGPEARSKRDIVLGTLQAHAGRKISLEEIPGIEVKPMKEEEGASTGKSGDEEQEASPYAPSDGPPQKKLHMAVKSEAGCQTFPPWPA